MSDTASSAKNRTAGRTLLLLARRCGDLQAWALVQLGELEAGRIRDWGTEATEARAGARRRISELDTLAGQI